MPSFGVRSGHLVYGKGEDSEEGTFILFYCLIVFTIYVIFMCGSSK